MPCRFCSLAESAGKEMCKPTECLPLCFPFPMNRIRQDEPSAASTLSAGGGRKTTALWVLGSLAAAGGYATLRYVVLGPVPWQQLPLYVANKALALAGLVLVVAAQCYRSPGLRRQLGCWGAGLLAGHGMASFMLLHPAYFPGWFTDRGQFTLQAGVSLLCGTLALVLVGYLVLASIQRELRDGEPSGSLLLGGGTLVLGLTALHLFNMGFSGWLTPTRWHGGLPPITLLGFLLASGALLGRLLAVGGRGPRPRNEAR